MVIRTFFDHKVGFKFKLQAHKRTIFDKNKGLHGKTNAILSYGKY